MGKQLLQILGMIRYEFRIHWRRRGLKAMFLALLVVLAFDFFFLATLGFRYWEGFPILVWWDVIAAPIWRYVAIFLMVMFPVAVAETIPRDRQFGVRELLDSLPLRPWTYLAGKLLGVWVSVGAAVMAILVIVGLLWWLGGGAYDLLVYAGMVLVGAGSLLIMNCGLTVLAAAGQPNVIRSLIVGFAGVIVLPVLLLLAFPPDSAAILFNPLHLPIWDYYYPWLAIPTTVILFGREFSVEATFALSVLGGLVELGGLAVYALWHNRHRRT